MAYETGTRGRLLAGRLRVVGPDPAPGRPVAAVDRDAPPATAAVRVALIDPTLDAEGRETWAAGWRSLAERRLVTPLVDLVEDEELGALAVLAMGASRPVAAGALEAADQAERLGAALAGAGLDLTDLRLDDLGLDDDGRLVLDTVRFPTATPLAPAAGGMLLLDLIGPVVEYEESPPVTARPARPAGRERGRRRMLLPVIVALLLAAGVIAFLPDRSTAPASIAPGDEMTRVDDEVLRALEATARPRPEPPRAKRPRAKRPARTTAQTPAPESTPIIVAEVAPLAVEPDADALPLAASADAGDGALPPLDGAGALMPVDGDGIPSADQGGLPPVAATDAEDGGDPFVPVEREAVDAPAPLAIPEPVP